MPNVNRVPSVESTEDLSFYLKSQRDRVDAALSQWFDGGEGEKLTESMRYSLFLPSKRIRPLFCLEACRAFVGSDEAALPAAMALEMVHTYSLIHDDLPSMDNDDLRRGKPTNHKVYGEAGAILAGDGLLTLAFEVLSKAGTSAATTRLAWIRELSQAAGYQGMVLGQHWDMESIRDSSVAALEALHRKKTGALLAASVAMGAQAAEAHPLSVTELREFGFEMGLAFQIRDDILDVIGGEEIGKPIRSDEKNKKPTYISVLGLEGAKAACEEVTNRALHRLETLNLPMPNRLAELTRFVIERKV